MIRAAVVGVGYLGRFHAQKYAAIDGYELVAVCDNDNSRAVEVAKECSCNVVDDYKKLLGKVDAVSIVVPTQLHYEVAKYFLENGVHTLVEKPITVTKEEAQELVKLARENNLVLQVGHLERFNPAVLALTEVLEEPLFIESHRLAPFNPRGADVNVVLDLMIHDIDIIQELVRSPVKSLAPAGMSVITDAEDIVNVRVEFESGCVANITASRVSVKQERKMRLFQKDACLVVDFQEKSLTSYHKGEQESENTMPAITADIKQFENDDAIMAEIESFLVSITTGQEPVVSGEDGLRALETALLLNEKLS